MKSWIWLALLSWLSACGRGSPPPGAGPALPPCEDSGAGTGFVQALLSVGCDGTLQPGRASWTVSDGAVTLVFPPEKPGPKGAQLVTSWPPLDEPPWLGHRVRRIVVLSGGSIRVEFGDRAADPARLFADPRLAGAGTLPREGDVRDAIDANEAEIVSRHDASIEYARSLGRTVRLLAYDRLYVVAFARGADTAKVGALAADVGKDWVGMGAAGARRLPSLGWRDLDMACRDGAEEADTAAAAAREPAGAGPAVGSSVTLLPTVSYRHGDDAAGQLAERVVSGGMREGPLAAVVAELVGSEGRMAVRPVADGGNRWSETDVAAVVGARAGPVHPCSLYAEVLRELAGWREGPPRRGAAVLPVGEAAAFAIGAGVGRGA